MELWLTDLINDWDGSVFLPEVLGKATGVAIGVLLSWFLLIRRRLRSMGKLQRGDSDDLLFQAHYLHRIPDGENADEHVQLLFRNVAEKRTLEQVYDNPAAAGIIRSLGDETTLNQPILPTQGTTPVCEPFEVDWELQLKSFKSGELTLEPGTWPEGLSN